MVTLALVACNVGSAKAAVLPAVLPSENPNIVTVAGTTIDIGDGGPATSALLKQVTHLAIDLSSGRLYLADNSDNRVRNVNLSTGIITTYAGTGLNGGSGDGGPATAAQLSGPQGSPAVDSSGNLYISEASGHRIRKIDAVTGIITTVAGNGVAGFSGDGTLATSAQLNTPRGVEIDSSGNIYIGDNANNRIRKVDATTGIITTVAGTGVAGSIGDGGLATAAQINGPWTPALDSSGNLYISEAAGNRIRKIDAITGIITTVAGTGIAGSSGDGTLATAAQLSSPRSVSFDVSGNFYIGDFTNARIRKVDATTGIITTVAGNGVSGFSGDGGPATAAQLSQPGDVVFDASGNFYIGDGLVVRKVNLSTGIITTFAGGGTIPTGNGGSAIAAQFSSPQGVNVDSSGNLYFAAGNGVRKVDATTGIITTVAGNGITGFSGDGGPATSAGFQQPIGLDFDASGNLYISDEPTQRVRKVDATTGIVTTIAGTGVAGSTGDGGLATAAKLSAPRGVKFDSSGNLYIADSANHKIRKVSTGGIITTIAGTGVSGGSGDGGLATAARLATPRDIGFDSSGNLYITEQNGHRVRKIDATTGIITTVAGTGVAGFSGDGDLATAAKLNAPISADFHSGNLYITDGANARVRRVNLTTGIITTISGTGVTGYSGDGGPAALAQLNTVRHLRIDASGNLYFSDNGNNRVRRMNLNATVTLDMASGLTTAYITLPSGHDPGTIDPATVRLQAIDSTTGAVRYVTSATNTTLQTSVASGSLDTVMDADNDTTPDTRVLQFDSATVDAWAADTFRVEGRFNDGAYFSGDSRPPADFTTGAVVTTGGTVTAGKWNSSNTGVNVTVPVANDSDLTGGTIQVKASSGSGFVDLGATNTIQVGDLGTSKTLSFTASQLEGIAGFSEGDTVTFTAVITDSAGNSTTGATSASTLFVDQTAPTTPTIDIVATDDIINAAERTATVTVTGTNESGSTVTLNGFATTADTATTWSYNLSAAAINAFGQGAETLTASATDAAGNPNAVNGTRDISVDTVAPTITAAQMRDADGNGKADRIALTFSESLADTAAGANGLDVISAADHGSCTGETADPIATNTLTLNFSCTTANTVVGDLTLALTANSGVRDPAGNQVANVTLTSDSSPAITDGAAPVLVSSTPADGATNVSRTDDFTLRFSEAMEHASTQSAFSLTPSAGTDAFSWSATDTVLMVNPASSLSTSRNYTIGLANTAQSSASGDPALATTSVAFTTAASGGGGGPTPPSISLIEPNGGENLAAGSSYQIIWSTNGDGIASERLALSTDSGESYSTLATGLTSGSYLWNIPSSLQTTHGRIRVEALDASGAVVASAHSSSDFTVTGTSSGSGGSGGSGGSTGTPPPTGGTSSLVEGADTSSSGAGAMTRAQADAQLPPGYPVDALVKLADDGNPATFSDSTVYYLGLDAKRHPFINAKAYASWYADFSQVQNIDGPTLASIPLGAPILSRPGTYWVKIQSDLRTYYVEPGYKLRWIKDEATAVKLGGPAWNKNIIDIDPAFFVLYADSADIDTSTLATSWPSGTLIDSSLNLQDDRHMLGLRWYVTGGKKRAFVPDAAFGANNFQSRFAWNHAEDVGSTQTLNALPSGPDITGFEDALFSLMH